MVKIAITGANGKMGRVIANLVSQRDDCQVIAGIDLNDTQNGQFPIVKYPADLSEKTDVIIEFSHPYAITDLLSYCNINNVPLVAATK
ncbi:MAG: 4-hydroxy-tetrahydrodipicolinate reductase, partial [Ruminococcus sp.]|nr:4-hydroxy-tetrahydrodipicolinate reductase [Ruminococcus sp.]